jgi:hypothetical protein
MVVGRVMAVPGQFSSDLRTPNTLERCSRATLALVDTTERTHKLFSPQHIAVELYSGALRSIKLSRDLSILSHG